MRFIIVAATLSLSVLPVSAQYYGSGSYGGNYGQPYGAGSNSRSHTVSPYTTDRGTYVAPHTRTNPNSTQYDNYGSRGNYNPYSGQYGTRSPRW